MPMPRARRIVRITRERSSAVDKIDDGRARAALGVLLAAMLLAAACSSPDVPKTPLGGSSSLMRGASDPLPPGLNASAAARLDSGNVAFRLKQYDQAMHYYRAAATDVPDHPAPWYGIYMVAEAQGNRALADSATRAVAVRSGGGELLDTGMVKAHGGADGPPAVAPAHPQPSTKLPPR